MPCKWIATQFTGIRYREHPTRKHGRQPDRYFNVRFKVGGISVNEGYGWASEKMTASKAALLMAELKEELRAGKGTGKLADRRKAREQAEADLLKAEQAAARERISYREYFHDTYWPDVSQDKAESALKAEASLHKNWILPALGSVPVRVIGELNIKKLSRAMKRAGRAPRSIEYAFACVRMVMNHAIRSGYHRGPNPVSSLPRGSRPKYDNKRVRFLTRDEAMLLLDTLKTRSTGVHNMTLLSIYCGARAGEIFSLQWSDVDQVNGLVTLRDTKSGKTRTVHMPETVKVMFATMAPGNNSTLVFPGKGGKQLKQISKTFDRTVTILGFNDGIEDRRQKVTFHTCRHTCASWLVQAGIPLFTVQKILGHSTIALTERYSHLAPDSFRAAAAAIERVGNISEEMGITVNLR